MKHTRVVLALVLCLLVAPALSACSGATSGVKAKLEPGPTAPLGGTIPFRLTVSYSRDAPSSNGETEAEAFVSLQEGLSLQDDSDWNKEAPKDGYTRYSRPITFQANVPQSFDISVKLNQQGEHRLDAGAIVRDGNSGEQGRADTKLLNVGEGGTTIREVSLTSSTTSP